MYLNFFSSRVLFLLAVFILIFIFCLSISVGPMSISFSDALQSLIPWSNTSSLQTQLVIQKIRLPRTILCLLVGAILAISGTVMQGLFRNPLAEPGIIGVSAGAGLGATIAIVLFSSLSLQYPLLMNIVGIPLCAFFGGGLSTLLVYALGTSRHGTSVAIMLLAGIAIGSLSGAMIGYLSFIADDQMLRDLSLWSMGSLAGATWTSILLASTCFILLLVLFSMNAQSLNALLLGESEAGHLGVNTQNLKRFMILLTAVGVGVTVSIAGMIGFIGLIVPHLGRMFVGPDHRKLIPLSAFMGAILLTGADMFARIMVSPAELPVGIVTAIIGSPFFIYLLFKQRGRM